jgi:hypothetical protein
MSSGRVRYQRFWNMVAVIGESVNQSLRQIEIITAMCVISFWISVVYRIFFPIALNPDNLSARTIRRSPVWLVSWYSVVSLRFADLTLSFASNEYACRYSVSKWDTLRILTHKKFLAMYVFHATNATKRPKIIYRPDNGGITYLWNLGQFQRDYTELQLRRL